MLTNIYIKKKKFLLLVLSALLVLMNLSNGFAQLPNVVAMEYFIDNDPGFGSAIPITVSTPGNTINETFNVDLSSVSDGIHKLYIRTLDANGDWSHALVETFYKQGIGEVASPDPNLVQVEYFIDNDPGFGSGIPVSITAATDINETFNVDLSTVIDGLHKLYIRTKDDLGNWGHCHVQSIYKQGHWLPVKYWWPKWAH